MAGYKLHRRFIDIFLLAEELGIGHERKEVLRKLYTSETFSSSEAKQRLYVGKGMNLIGRMILAGEYNNKELTSIVEYCLIAIEAKKYNLDFEKAFKDYEIEKFLTVYPPKKES